MFLNFVIILVISPVIFQNFSRKILLIHESKLSHVGACYAMFTITTLWRHQLSKKCLQYKRGSYVASLMNCAERKILNIISLCNHLTQFTTKSFICFGGYSIWHQYSRSYLAGVKLMAKVSASIDSMTGQTTLVGSSAILSNRGSNQCGLHSPMKVTALPEMANYKFA